VDRRARARSHRSDATACSPWVSANASASVEASAPPLLWPVTTTSTGSGADFTAAARNVGRSLPEPRLAWSRAWSSSSARSAGVEAVAEEVRGTRDDLEDDRPHLRLPERHEGLHVRLGVVGGQGRTLARELPEEVRELDPSDAIVLFSMLPSHPTTRAGCRPHRRRPPPARRPSSTALVVPRAGARQPLQDLEPERGAQRDARAVAP
jgi:hypothetical protein